MSAPDNPVDAASPTQLDAIGRQFSDRKIAQFLADETMGRTVEEHWDRQRRRCLFVSILQREWGTVGSCLRLGRRGYDG